MIIKYCPNKCGPEFDAKETFCPKCGTRLYAVRLSNKNNVDVKIDINGKKLIVDNREMIYLGDENVDLSDPKYMLLTISKFKDDKRVIRGFVTVLDPLDNLREYMCIVSDTPNLQIRGRNDKKELFGFYNKHISIPRVDMEFLIVCKNGQHVCVVDSFYDKYVSGDKIMIFIDPNDNTRFFLLYVKKDIESGS